MNIVNEQIKHVLYGDGKVISQEADTLSIEFSEQYGIKKFLYPDAFDKYLKLYNPDIEMPVLEELHDKQARIEAEEFRKQQEYENSVKGKALEKSRLGALKKKSSTKSKVSKQKSKSDLALLDESAVNEE